MVSIASFVVLLSSIYFIGAAEIEYVHLALTGDPTEMMVSYYTDEDVPTSASWGLQSGQYLWNATGSSKSWKDGYGFNHNVLLQGLNPSTKYYFVCGDSNTGLSKESTFTSAPSTPVPFTISVYGDMGITNSADTMARVIQHTQSGDYDFIYHVGDISYADDHVLSFQTTWNTFFERMEPVTSVIPYMVLPGNHEYSSFDPLLYFATRNFVVYNQRFAMPGNSSMYYSFDYSNVHFISFSTETSFPGAPYGDPNDYGDQLQWLEQDLIEANKPENRQKRPWIIVGGHRPIYSSCSGYSENGVPINGIVTPSNSLTLQEVFEDLFMKYQVDLIITGHVHSYERNYPTYKNKRTGGYTNPPSPIGIIVGCAGNIEGLQNPNEEHWTQPQPEWSAFRYGDTFGYGVLKVNNNTLNWKFYSAPDDRLIDEVQITKQ